MNLWLRETFVSLRVPAYRVFWWSTLLNFAALWGAIVARGFLAFDLTESATALGALFLGFGIPMLIMSPVGGLVADRLPRKPVMVASQWLFAAITLVLAVLTLAGLIEVWMLFAAAVVEGGGVALAIPARQALIGDLVEEDDLGNAVALQQVSFNAVRIVAPTVAGALIAVEVVGVGGTFLLMSSLYALSAVVAMLIPAPPPKTSEGHGSPIADIVEGMRYVRGRPALVVLLLVVYALETTAFSYFVFIPAVVSDIFDRGSVELGLLTTAIAVGAFAASLVVARIAGGDRAWGAHLWSSLVFGPLLMAFAVSPVYVAAVLVGVALGAAETGFFALNQSLAMRYAHRDYYGRVQALLLFGFALNGFVALLYGILADAFGLREMLFGLGVASTLLVVGVAVLSRRIGAAADAHARHEEARATGPAAAS